MNATEPETGGDSVRYRLETGEISQFQIEEVTGVITTSAGLDRETMSSYVLTVEATDIGSNPDNPLSTFVQARKMLAVSESVCHLSCSYGC